MLPIELIRKDPDRVKRAAELKGETAPIDEILQLDKEWREHVHKAELIKEEQNKLSKEFAKTRDEALKEKLRAMADTAKEEMANAEKVKRDRDDLLLRVPNLFDDSVPIGKTEADNKVAREWGTKPEFDFTPRTHYDLGESLGIMDFEHAARVTGSRFAFLLGDGARLERALVQFMLDVHTREHGYTEVLPPYMVNSQSMTGTGQLPKFAEDSFKCEHHDLWLIPTAEVPLTNLYRDEVLDPARLPLSVTAYTPCFRSEAGSYGKDVRGIVRQHQFQKVELVKFASPQESYEQHERLTRDAETVLQKLGLHYRVMLLCTRDMSPSSAKTYDLEVWLPGQQLYREISSCSNFESFQARRANIRWRPEGGKKSEYVHTLNGSGLAVGRTWLAVLENYQQADGTVVVPEALRSYLGTDRIVPRKF